MAKWFLSAKKADFQKIAEEFQIDPVIARIIRNRDMITNQEISTYLFGDKALLHDPLLLKDLPKAVKILQEKIKEHRKIRIIGDYDVDGICATYILYRSISFCGGDVDCVIPHRMKDGYGINGDLIRKALDEQVDTIITCDNGIAAKEAFVLAKEMGMTCIITDHHEVPFTEQNGIRSDVIPAADAVVDPKRQDCAYPFKEICGAFVACKLGQVLVSEFTTKKETEELTAELLEVAGIATVCDIMPLRDENRVLVRETLKSLKNPKNMGLRALMKVNGIEPLKVTAFSIGFVMGPCINATGRLDTAFIALDLLMAGDGEDAVSLATRLKELNTSRKEMTEQGVALAMKELENEKYQEQKILVLYLPRVHESLAGIIAGRVREKTGKPAFVLTDGEDGVKGSARSIEAYSVYEELTRCSDLFTKFGGHKMAAGLSMPKENVEAFRTRINENCTLTPEDFEEKILIDVPMPMSYVTKKLILQLKLLEPFGNGNEKPVFAQKNLAVESISPMGKNGDMARLKVRDEAGGVFEMVMFRGAGQLLLEKPKKIDVLYYPTINEFRGRESIQFQLQNYK